MSARNTLREATREAHDRVDALFSRFDLGNRESYAEFLAVQAAAYLPIEAALDAGGIATLVADWGSHRRADALRADLAALGAPTFDPIEPPTFADPPALLGGAYVLEGSRLGGKMLSRVVRVSFPREFLAAAQPPGRWRAFIETIDRLLTSTDALERAATAALSTFDRFEQAARARLMEAR